MSVLHHGEACILEVVAQRVAVSGPYEHGQAASSKKLLAHPRNHHKEKRMDARLTPFRIDIPQHALDDLRTRLQQPGFPSRPR